MATSVDTEIRSLVSQAHAIERTIDAARREASQAESNIRRYEQRLREVQDIKRSLSNSFDGVVRSVSSRQSAARGDYSGATSGLSHEGLLVAGIRRDAEKHTEQDSFGASMHEHLQREVSRCENELNNAKASKNRQQINAENCCTKRRTLIDRARTLSRQPEATVHVRESLRY